MPQPLELRSFPSNHFPGYNIKPKAVLRAIIEAEHTDYWLAGVKVEGKKAAIIRRNSITVENTKSL